MKSIFVLLVLCLEIQAAELPQKTIDKICESIYKIEGGAKTKYPYGIKSVNVGGDKNKAKIVCERTVVNNWKRWEAAGRKEKYFEFLARRYCPVPGDKTGLNKHWLRNLRAVSGLDL